MSDQEVFAALYPQLRRFAAVVGSVDDDPDDLVQDALVGVLRVGGLGEIDSPGAYLRRAILNRAADRRRRWWRRRRALAKVGPDASVAAIFPSELGDLDRLSPIDRALLYLADVEGLTLVEVAQQLGLTHDAARLRASRARRHLRATIESEETR